jgi:hypothetical protein
MAFLGRVLPKGGVVWLERDAVQRDAAGRTLVYLRVADDKTGAGLLPIAVVLDQGHGALNPASADGARRRWPRVGPGPSSGGLWGPCVLAHVLLFSPTPTPTPPGPTPLSPTPTLVPLLTDCGNVTRYIEVNNYFQANPAAQPSLDPHYDGRACEVYLDVDQPVQGIAVPQNGNTNSDGGYPG